MIQMVLGRLVWITAPGAASNAGDSRARWKVMTLDALTYFLFALLIRSSHPLRKVFFAIDWRGIDERCAAVYENGKRGAPAYPPQVLFRIIALMFLSGTPFESATLLRLETDIAWRWFAGLSLWTRVPDAGTLSHFRERLGIELFDAILTDLIKACDEAGLIGHEESYYDMTGVEASATQATPYQRAVILARAISIWLDKGQSGAGVITREQIAQIALEVLEESHPSLKDVTPEQIVSSQDNLEAELAECGGIPGWLSPILEKLSMLKQCAAGTPEAIIGQMRQAARALALILPHAFGNPDARVGHTRTDGTICGYRSGFLVDAKHFIITAVVFVALSKPEAPTVVTALEKHYAIFGRHPKKLGADSAFDNDKVHLYTEEHDIFSGTTVRSRPGAAGVYHADAFVWNDAGQLLCPAGAEMAPAGGPYKDGTERYRAAGDAANART